MTRRSNTKATLPRTILKRLIGTSVACVAVLAPTTTVQAQDDLQPVEDVRYQSDTEALEEDLTLIAEAHGWTVAEARAQHEAAEAVGAAAEAVYDQAPETFVGSILSDKPGGAPSLLLKGPAEDWVTDLATAGAVPIQIVDEQPYSFTELQDLNVQLVDTLIDLGYQNISSGPDIEAGAIVADVQAEPGLATSGTDLQTLLPKEISDGVELTVTDELGSDLEHAFGGALVRNSSGGRCTSGWTVVNSSGTTGVTTAGHCNGINKIREHNVGTWPLSHKKEYLGWWGDVEWKTSTHAEPARFYSSANNLRNTNAVERFGAISIGESICLYGRVSNKRNCSSDVSSTAWTCVLDGKRISSMVRMNKNLGVKGDSGGGWSHGNRAYGGHVGQCGSRDVFTVADYFDQALGVRVRTR